MRQVGPQTYNRQQNMDFVPHVMSSHLMLSSPLAYRALVHVDLALSEVLHLLERVDRDEDWPDVCEDPVVHVALLQVVDDGRLVDLGQEGHVVDARPLVVR